jgi:5-formyltetrahydrofolate cyclo-ligase
VNLAPEPNPSSQAEQLARRALRTRLLGARAAFVASAEIEAATAALSDQLRAALVPLEPDCLGLYWPLACEFNAAAALAADPAFANTTRALPYARRAPRALEFRRWDGSTPVAVDECGIGTGEGAATVPDVVVVPCVGFTAAGHRLGYGGGYYDRWLAAHRHVLAIGIGWSFAEVDAATFAARPHDVPLAFVVTERGIVG